MMKHYTCMVDLLARSGYLEQALEFIEKKMPVKPDANLLTALLSSCYFHKNVELAKSVRKRLLELEPREAGAYMLLSNFYGQIGDLDGVVQVLPPFPGEGFQIGLGQEGTSLLITAAASGERDNGGCGGKLQHYQNEEAIFGVFSLIFWTLTLKPLLKYVIIVLSADDNGEGGTFALYSLLCSHVKFSLLPNQQAADEELSTYNYEHSSLTIVASSPLKHVDHYSRRKMVARHGKSLHRIVENLQIMEIWMILEAQEEEGKRRFFLIQLSNLLESDDSASYDPLWSQLLQTLLGRCIYRQTFVRERTCHRSRQPLRTQENVMK
ncbi:hypothetical protein GIB67_025576 [Kingdonia uniflora]|uniref:K+ potassium transporter integral membrane domain-containing protein n=1 Tax=Kingdonia uniflora TaxID=39325 RepID=A0A7J7M0I4_9MAGN|nr:hypothetical protein GIB67_025576 [Kingdonia uniflora]